MAERFSNSDKLVLFNVETTNGTEEVLTIADAIAVESPAYATTGDVDSGENEVTSSLDAGNPVPLGVAATLNFGIRVKGVTAPGTTPPRWTRALRASSMLQTLTAAALPGTATGTGTTTTILGAVTLSATDDLYNGMPITITGGTNSGYEGVIVDYVGSSKTLTVYPAMALASTATTAYSIYANARYTPTSLDQKTGTAHFYDHPNQSAVNAILRKLVGGVGSPTFEVTNRGIARLQFAFQGLQPTDPADTARLATPTYDGGDPQPFRAAKAYLGGSAVQFNRFSLNWNNQIAQPDDPAAENGLDYGSVTSRRLDFTLVANKRLNATRNAVTAFKAGTSHKLWLAWGTGTGQRISLLMTDARYIAPPSDENVNNFSYESLQGRANGRDDGLYIAIY